MLKPTKLQEADKELLSELKLFINCKDTQKLSFDNGRLVLKDYTGIQSASGGLRKIMKFLKKIDKRVDQPEMVDIDLLVKISQALSLLLSGGDKRPVWMTNIVKSGENKAKLEKMVDSILTKLNADNVRLRYNALADVLVKNEALFEMITGCRRADFDNKGKLTAPDKVAYLSSERVEKLSKKEGESNNLMTNLYNLYTLRTTYEASFKLVKKDEVTPKLINNLQKPLTLTGSDFRTSMLGILSDSIKIIADQRKLTPGSNVADIDAEFQNMKKLIKAYGNTFDFETLGLKNADMAEANRAKYFKELAEYFIKYQIILKQYYAKA